jgi:hypothetical protein
MQYLLFSALHPVDFSTHCTGFLTESSCAGEHMSQPDWHLPEMHASQCSRIPGRTAGFLGEQSDLGPVGRYDITIHTYPQIS